MSPHTAPKNAEEPLGVSCRAIFISDLHLGTRGCQAEALLSFLRHYHCEYLYLVGDILDLWQLKRRWYWPPAHNTVVQKILRLARHGVQVRYVRGNHDPVFEMLSDLVPVEGERILLGDIQIVDSYVHETADGRRLWVIHGDQFDVTMRYAPWLTRLGDHGYTLLLFINRRYQWAVRRIGLHSRWSLSATIKRRVKQAVQFIGDYEQVLAQACLREGYEGGHLRPYSSRGDQGNRRHPVSQRRRLGGELHGTRGTRNGAPGTGALGCGIPGFPASARDDRGHPDGKVVTIRQTTGY